MDLFEQISNDIKEAMKAKDKVRLETLRNVKKVFLEAKTAPGANDTLTDDAALKLMQIARGIRQNGRDDPNHVRHALCWNAVRQLQLRSQRFLGMMQDEKRKRWGPKVEKTSQRRPAKRANRSRFWSGSEALLGSSR